MGTRTDKSSPTGLFGRTRAAVLGLLLVRPDERFHLRQIARLTGAGLGAVQRELAALTTAGILRREVSGRQVYFQADPASPVFADLQGLIIKTSGAADVLRAALSDLAPRISVALVFGSVARGAMRAESDVDLMVISPDVTMRELARALRPAGEALGRVVNPKLYRPAEWAQCVRSGHPLARAIQREPRVLLVGDDRELRAVASKRVAEGASGRSR
jgi:predicted nucleotidyltransferase